MRGIYNEDMAYSEVMYSCGMPFYKQVERFMRHRIPRAAGSMNPCPGGEQHPAMESIWDDKIPLCRCKQSRNVCKVLNR